MKHKKNWILIFVMILFALVVLLTNRGGDVRIARRNVGESQEFTQEDIESAMDVVEHHFKKTFDGCTLISMTYDEARSDKSADGWKENYGADEAIVLLSRFYVDESGGDGSLNPESYYDNWQWILTRNSGEKWMLQTWGYG